MKLHYQIFYYENYANSFCKNIVQLTAQNNGYEHPLPLVHLHKIIVETIVQFDWLDDTSISIDEEKQSISIDILEDGEWNTGLLLQLVELP
jgi:hypothetical protein